MTPSSVEIFFDIETDWKRRITVIGFTSTATGLVQLVGQEITPERLLRELPAHGTLYTYNGHSFDLSCVRRQLNLDLRQRFASVDLRWVCQRNGLRGGQKRIEQRLGVSRHLPGLDGRDAIVLWQRYRRGDKEALTTLLQYNSEDLRGLVLIKEHLVSQRMLAAALA